MVIRAAHPTEAMALATLGARLWRETYTGLVPEENLSLHVAKTFGLRQQMAELADPGCLTLVLDRHGVLEGYALLRAGAGAPALEACHFVKPLEVARFYVDSSLHGSGSAQKLMEAVRQHALHQGHDGLWLQVWEKNPRARRFYSKCGFTDAGGATYRVGEQVDQDRVLVHALMIRPL